MLDREILTPLVFIDMCSIYFGLCPMEDHGKGKKVELSIIISISCEVFSVTEQRKEFDNEILLA